MELILQIQDWVNIQKSMKAVQDNRLNVKRKKSFLKQQKQKVKNKQKPHREYFIKYCFILLIYLKDRVIERQREMQRPTIHWFIPQMATTAKADPGGSQEPELHPGLSCRWMQEPKHLTHLLVSQEHWIGSGTSRKKSYSHGI